MANSFYNINISKYNPAEHTTAGQGGIAENIGDSDNIPQTQPPQINEEIPTETINPQYSRLNALDSTILINEAY